MLAKHWDLTLKKFILKLLSWVFKIFLIVTVPATLAVDTISLIDIFTFTALAIGLALRCSLANITAVFSCHFIKKV
jgi:small conductance mechanosensitive channel